MYGSIHEYVRVRTLVCVSMYRYVISIYCVLCYVRGLTSFLSLCSPLDTTPSRARMSLLLDAFAAAGREERA